MSLTAEQITKAKANLQEQDAKRVSLSYSPDIGRVDAIRKFRVNHDKHRTVLEYLDTYGYHSGTEGASVIPNPRVGDDILPGNYAVMVNEDGTQHGDVTSVYQRLRLVHSAETAEDLAGLEYVTTQDEQSVRPFGFWSGTQWDRALIWYDMNPASKTAVEELTAANLAAVLAPGWTCVDRKWQDNGDNTGAFIIMFRKASWLKTWTDRLLTAVTGSGADEGQRHEAHGLPKEGYGGNDIHTVFAAVTADDGYVIKSKALSQNPNNGERIILRSQQAVNQYVEEDGNVTAPSASDALIIYIQDGNGKYTPVIKRRWYRWDEAAKDYLTGRTPDGDGGYVYGPARSNVTFEGSTYTHLSVSIADHHDGAYSVTQHLYRSETVVANDIAYYEYEPQTKTVENISPGIDDTEYIRWHIYRVFINFDVTWGDAHRAAREENVESYNGTPTPNAYRVRNSLRVGSYGNYFFKSTVTWYVGVTDFSDVVPVTLPSS